MVARLLLSVLLCFSMGVSAQEYLNISVASKHFNTTTDYCEINPGAQYQRFRSEHTYFLVGGYHNSQCKFAGQLWLGAETDDRHFGNIPFAVGVMGGLTTGYPSPIVGSPYIRFGDKTSKIHTKMLFLPSDQPIVAFVIGIRL